MSLKDVILDVLLGLLALAFFIGIVFFLAWGTGRLTF
jgi:hypothetical protein